MTSSLAKAGPGLSLIKVRLLVKSYMLLQVQPTHLSICKPILRELTLASSLMSV